MTNYRLETDRLLMREMNESDAQNFFELNNDPQVLRYTGDEPFESIEHSRNFLKAYPEISYLKDGLGRLTCIRKSDQEIIGWCGLRLQPEGLVDLGYRFHHRFWNQGFATESSIAALDWGFGVKQLDQIIARASKENGASIRVMQKLGMRYQKDEHLHGADSVIYIIDRDDYLKNRPLSLKAL